MSEVDEIKLKIKELVAQLKSGMAALLHHTNEFKKKYVKLTPAQREQLKRTYDKGVAQSKKLLNKLFDRLDVLFLKLKEHLMNEIKHLAKEVLDKAQQMRSAEMYKLHSMASQAHNHLLNTKQSMNSDDWNGTHKHLQNIMKSLVFEL